MTHLEALGRLITGISAWLELGPDSTIEGKLRAEYIDLALKSIATGVNPESLIILILIKDVNPWWMLHSWPTVC